MLELGEEDEQPRALAGVVKPSLGEQEHRPRLRGIVEHRSGNEAPQEGPEPREEVDEPGYRDLQKNGPERARVGREERERDGRRDTPAGGGDDTPLPVIVALADDGDDELRRAPFLDASDRCLDRLLIGVREKA